MSYAHYSLHEFYDSMGVHTAAATVMRENPNARALVQPTKHGKWQVIVLDYEEDNHAKE